MKRKIFSLCAALTIAVTLVTALSVMMMYYRFYKETVQAEIRSECLMIAAGLEEVTDNAYLLEQFKNAMVEFSRMTWIAPDGTVLYDSNAAAKTLTNHADRVEIAEAIETGQGEIVRHSDTMNGETYYYARRLNDGSVLRLSRQMNRITEVFSDTIPLLLFLITALIAVSLLISSLLTRVVLRPIQSAARELDGLLGPAPLVSEALVVYEELSPFIQKIRLLRGQVDEYVQSLREERDTVENILRNMREGLVFLDSEKRIVLLNKSALSLLGAPENLSYTGQNLVYLSRSPRLGEAVDHTLAGHGGLSFEEDVTLQEELGSKNQCHRIFINPVLDESGKTQGAILLLIDVTQEIRAERIRRDFAANVSHELKTPLTSISGFAELLENGMLPDDKARRDAAERIHRESSRLIALVEDIMRVSEIETRGGGDERSTFALREVASEAVHALETAAQGRCIVLTSSCEDISLTGSRPMLYELLFNLLDNAIKYNHPEGTVSLHIHRDTDNTVILVEDSGIGIAPEHLDRIFERFYRVDKSRSKQTGGTGLGLSIVKHIVEFHHGTIQVESTPGEGTKFRAVLPLNS